MPHNEPPESLEIDVEHKTDKKCLLPKSSSCLDSLNNETNETFELTTEKKPALRGGSVSIKALEVRERTSMLWKKSQSDVDRILLKEEEDQSFGISEIDNEMISDSLFSLTDKTTTTTKSGDSASTLNEKPNTPPGAAPAQEMDTVTTTTATAPTSVTTPTASNLDFFKIEIKNK